MVLLAIETLTWSQILIVTVLGFGIVVVLLFCLVYILRFLGWTMQKLTEPKVPKAPKAEPIQEKKTVTISAEPTDEGTKAAIAMAIASADDEHIAAIAYAIYRAQNNRHDIPTPMINLRKHETAWNEKSVGMNNVGF